MSAHTIYALLRSSKETAQVKFYIRYGVVNGDDVARTYTLLEALYVARAESSNVNGRYYGRMLTVFHNRKIVAYVQEDTIIRKYTDWGTYTPESFVARYGDEIMGNSPKELPNALLDLESILLDDLIDSMVAN